MHERHEGGALSKNRDASNKAKRANRANRAARIEIRGILAIV
jgi:hypothetical protein